MKRLALALAVAVCSAACVHVEETVRTERGPLLRSFDRPRVVTGGVRAQLEAKWPTLTVHLEGYDTCRTEVVDEYAEDRITERSTSGAAAGLSTGVVMTAVGLGVLAAQGLFSDAPNRDTIDAAGYYGPSPRQVARGWALVPVVIGVPALVVGIIGVVRSGTDTQTVKVEQVASQADRECHQRAIDGPLQLVTERGRALELKTEGGRAEVSAAALEGAGAERLVFYSDREVALDQGSTELLAAFSACAQLEGQQVAAPELLSIGSLLQRLERSRACRRLRPELDAAVGRLEAELGRRREGGEAGAFLPGARRLQSFEEAVAAYPPRLHLVAGSADLGRLDTAEAIAGLTVLVQGTVLEGVTANIGVVQVDGRQLFVFLPSDAPWGQDFGDGSAVELIGTMAGLQTVGERTAPLVRALYMRAVK